MMQTLWEAAGDGITIWSLVIIIGLIVTVDWKRK